MDRMPESLHAGEPLGRQAHLFGKPLHEPPLAHPRLLREVRDAQAFELADELSHGERDCRIDLPIHRVSSEQHVFSDRELRPGANRLGNAFAQLTR
ncbi:MAG TPA: hypothetical protein VN541_19100 [Tepidisphaeraceae bacterium]|nr:hypothetical protein [Tepidisphaeraceae bacterium]